MAQTQEWKMSSPLYFSQDSVTRFKKRKARFTFSEVHILLDEVRKHRHIVVGKFNRGVPTDIKKRTWAEITARVNEIGECQREVIEIIKKWSDLKCDTKRKVSAMRLGTVASRGLNARLSRDLTSTENVVHQILEMDDKGEHLGGTFGNLGDDDDGQEEEDEIEEEYMVGIQENSSPDRGMDMPSMPPPPLAHSMNSSMEVNVPVLPGAKEDRSMPIYTSSSRDSQPSFDMPYEVPGAEDNEAPLLDSDEEHNDLLPSTLPLSNLTEDPQGNNEPHNSSGTQSSPATSSFSAALPPSSQPAQNLRDSMLQSASLSVQEQHASNVLLETVSRSLELLSESVQQLAETQQEFVRESLQLQRETVQVLRDFTGGALALMHDKLNGRPTL